MRSKPQYHWFAHCTSSKLTKRDITWAVLNEKSLHCWWDASWTSHKMEHNMDIRLRVQHTLHSRRALPNLESEQNSCPIPSQCGIKWETTWPATEAKRRELVYQPRWHISIPTTNPIQYLSTGAPVVRWQYTHTTKPILVVMDSL